MHVWQWEKAHIFRVVWNIQVDHIAVVPHVEMCAIVLGRRLVCFVLWGRRHEAVLY